MTIAGVVASPNIIPIKTTESTSLFNITNKEYININCDTENTDLYFTTDGTKPNPYKLKVNGKEVTFKYVGPFLLKNGKRTVKAIAIKYEEDILSSVTTKTFVVGNQTLEKSNPKQQLVSQPQYDNQSFSKPRRINKNEVKATVEESKNNNCLEMQPINASINLPDGPFTTTNYSGTQINVWGVSPHAIYPFGNGQNNSQFNENTEGCADITNALLKTPISMTPKTESVTREEMESMMNNFMDKVKSQKQEKVNIIPAKPIETKFSPMMEDKCEGKDLFQVMSHIWAHTENYCGKNTSFRTNFSTLKIGKLLNAFVSNETNGLNINFRFESFNKPARKASIVQQTQVAPPKPISVKKVEKPPVRKISIKPPPAEANKKKIVGRRSSMKDKKLEADKAYLETEEYEQAGTLKSWECFNSERDAELLRTSMKGIGTDEKQIINIMGYRSFDQRAEVVEMFKTLFGKDLIKELEGELSGNFETICTALCLRPAELDAKYIYDSIKGLGTDEDCLTEILCTRTNKQIKVIKEVYEKKYKNKLESDVKEDTSGCYRKVLLSQVAANRIENPEFDRTAAKNDAKKLYSAGEEKWGTDESAFINILCKRSFPHLRAVFEEYTTVSKKTMLEAIDSEFSGDIKTALKTVVRVIQNKPAYFAYKLNKAIKGMGTDDDALVRIVISRCEIDMVQIMDSFQTQFNEPLSKWIEGDTSGDYCQMLLALIGIRDAPIITQDDLDAVGDPPELEEVEEEKIEETPTVTPFSGFNCDEDCQVLKKAMKGFGTDEAAIIKVMGHRSSDQRVQIVENYKKLFNKDLRKELKSELSGDFEETILALCEGKLEHDAFQLMKSMKGLGTDENGLIDILCTRSSAQIEKIREYYKNKYKKNLEDDISSETSGHFKRLLISMTQANRPEGCVIDRAKARNDAKKIHEAAHKFGTDESRFNAILCSRSYAQLRATFEEYKKLTSKDIQDTIKDEMSGDLSAGMISIVQCVENKSKHFAKRLYQSTKGLGSDDNAIIRIVVGQCEIDMVQIKQQFQTIYQNSLKDYLSDDISGDYKKIILALIGEG